MYDDTGFPNVFAGLGPEPIEPIGAPDAAILRNEAVVQAAAQTVKILGEAPACNADLEGSGFAFAPGRFLTNAHVVAATKRLQVVTRGGQLRRRHGRLLRPRHRSRRDRRARSSGPAADLLGIGVDRGENVAVIGYPENGGLDATPARVRDQLVAPGTTSTARDRSCARCSRCAPTCGRATPVAPSSNRDGEVVGVVFAASVDRDDTGYAMTSRQVASAVASGISANEAVSTGPCP